MTAQTVLRRIRTDDAEAIARYCADRDLAWMTSRIPHPYTREMAEDFCAVSQAPDARNWAIADGAALIGMAGYDSDGDTADIGYWIGAPFAGQGHASRAAKLLAAKAFSEPQIGRLTACVFQGNPASARILIKTGFTQGADCSGESVARGPGTYPTWTFALERAAWEAAP